MAVVGLWRRLVCSDAGRALALARQPEVLAKLEGVARLLKLKQAGDQKYLQKLGELAQSWQLHPGRFVARMQSRV